MSKDCTKELNAVKNAERRHLETVERLDQYMANNFNPDSRKVRRLKQLIDYWHFEIEIRQDDLDICSGHKY